MPRTLSEQEFRAIEDALIRQAPAGLDEDNFERWIGPRLDGAVAEAENSNAPVSGSALRRFVVSGASMLNPVAAVKGVASAVMHPIDTYHGMVGAAADQYGKARDSFDQGHYIEAAGHAAAGTLPVIGPAAASAGEQMVAGDIAGGLGSGAGLLAPFAASGALRGRVALQARKGVPATLEREAAQQVSQRVLAPGNVAFKGRAEAIAPEVLRRGLKGGREELAQAADEGMAQAGQHIDDAIDAGGGPQSGVIVDPIVSQLERKIADLSINGKPIPGAEGRVRGLRARIDYLQQNARSPAQQPGVVPQGAPPPTMRAMSFDELRRFRDEQYRLADEAKAYHRMGNPHLGDEAFAATESGGAVRQEFARLSPDLNAANADYTFYKTLGDVLDPAQGRPKVTAPSEGVTGGAATSGAVVGGLVSPKAAFVLGVVRPWLRKVRSSPAWQMADAHSKMRLAEAIRAGDVPAAQKWMARIGEGAVATSPSESRSRTTEPLMQAP